MLPQPNSPTLPKNVNRRYRDRDFVRTVENLLFCVVGSVHPRDRTIAYVKYMPSKQGLWSKNNYRFKRVMQKYTIPSLLHTFKILRTDYPHYFLHPPSFRGIMTAVPTEFIAAHYKPEEKMAQILQSLAPDLLEKKVKQLVLNLTDLSGVPKACLGVTGSVLLNIHQGFSDIDLTVYGRKNCFTLRQALRDIYYSRNQPIKRLKGSALKEWCTRKVRHHPLTIEDAARLYQRKWNIGIFESTPFSIHPIKVEEEVTETYGDYSFYPEGQAIIHARVHNNAECFYLPSVYLVKNVKIIKSTQDIGKGINEVVSYESLYDNFAQVGDWIEARGKVEQVIDSKTGQTYRRILVGSIEGKGLDYIRLVPQSKN